MRRLSLAVALASMNFISVHCEARCVHPDLCLHRAANLVSQGDAQIRATHWRNPRAYGGHDVQAERYLRLASRELSEAAVYRKYNRGRR